VSERVYRRLSAIESYLWITTVVDRSAVTGPDSSRVLICQHAEVTWCR